MTDTAKLIAQADDWLASEYDVVPLTLVKSLRAALEAAEAERDAHRGTILILTGSLKRSEQTVEGERQNREAAEAERDDWKSQWEKAEDDLGAALAENRRLRTLAGSGDG